MSHILLIKTHALGDVLMTTSAIRAIYESKMYENIYYLTGRWSSHALADNPYLKEVIVFDDDALFGYKIYKLIPHILSLRRHKFDTILIFSASSFIHFIGYLIGASQIVGFGSSRFLNHGIDFSYLKNNYAPVGYNSLLKPLNISYSSTALDFTVKKVPLHKSEGNNHETLSRFLDSYERGVVGIFCGGGKNPRDLVFAKRWGVENFIELGKRLSYDGYGILLFGSIDDRDVNNMVKTGLKENAFDLSGFFTIQEAGYLMQKCRIFITNDSAPFHISYCLGVPTLGIFGPSDSALLCPTVENCFPIQSKAPCSPCYGNELFFNKCSDPVCMNSISVDKVYKKAIDILKHAHL